jgi:hypothetical protein
VLAKVPALYGAEVFGGGVGGNAALRDEGADKSHRKPLVLELLGERGGERVNWPVGGRADDVLTESEPSPLTPVVD